MATRDEFNALYRESKELEATEEGPRLPEMPGSTDFYELLGAALSQAKQENGCVEIRMDHPTQVRIKIFGGVYHGADWREGNWILRRELTHYL